MSSVQNWVISISLSASGVALIHESIIGGACLVIAGMVFSYRAAHQDKP